MHTRCLIFFSLLYGSCSVLGCADKKVAKVFTFTKNDEYLRSIFHKLSPQLGLYIAYLAEDTLTGFNEMHSVVLMPLVKTPGKIRTTLVPADLFPIGVIRTPLPGGNILLTEITPHKPSTSCSKQIILAKFYKEIREVPEIPMLQPSAPPLTISLTVPLDASSLTIPLVTPPATPEGTPRTPLTRKHRYYRNSISPQDKER